MGTISETFEINYCATQVQRLDGIIKDIVNCKTYYQDKIAAMTEASGGLEPNSAAFRSLKAQMDSWQNVIHKLDLKLENHSHLLEMFKKRKIIADQNYREALQNEFSTITKAQ